MNIAVVGLGLIGGSFCKAIKAYTNHTVLGLDISKESTEKALQIGAIDKAISTKDLNQADITIICLYPEQTIEFFKKNHDKFKEQSIVCDACGVKDVIVSKAEEIFEGSSVKFVGLHPMSGREFSGFEYSKEDLYQGSSLVIVNTDKTNKDACLMIEALAMKIGFGKVVYSSAKEHDEIIAFTSQLAHVVSNAYIKSPTAMSEKGFTGGSFQDLTRVAKLNPAMWSELFLLNKEPLLKELDLITEHLNEYKEALLNDDLDGVFKLLKEGSDLKEKCLEKEYKSQQ